MLTDEHFQFSFPRYLDAKRTVDDRSLSQAVWRRFITELYAMTPGPHPRRILEVGGGTCSLLRRFMGVRLAGAHYTVVEVDGDALSAGRDGLTAWAKQNGWSVCAFDESLVLFENRQEGKRVEVEFLHADVFEWMAARPADAPKYHAILGQAVLDLFDVDVALPMFLELLEPGWLFYFPITFDGETVLEPSTGDGDEDDLAVQLYHRSMDERQVAGKLSGDSRAGRHFFAQARAAGAEIVLADSSDWLVYADANGTYPAEEAYFLRCILHYFKGELARRPAEFPPELRERWMAERCAQLERGELVYMAHQLDFLGRKPKI